MGVKTKILIAVTSHAELGATGKRTGYYLSEVSEPYFELAERGFEVDFVSPKGGTAPMDPGSRNAADTSSRRFLETPALLERLGRTLKAEEVDPSLYAGILFSGGHGTMWDFAEDAGLARLCRGIYERGGVVAAVCHGPAALVNVTLNDGTPLVRGRRVAAFTDAEERAVGLTEVVPFSLASSLVARGALHESAGLWQEKVVVDGRLITGQNPASAAGVGRAMAAALRAMPEQGRGVTVMLRLEARDPTKLRSHLLEVIPVTRRASGCRYSHSYQSQGDPRKFLLIQGWDSAEQQRAYLAWRGERGDLKVLLALLDSDPVQETFECFDR